ncbi:MAG: CAP domain-containing protein, partial [bacterium]
PPGINLVELNQYWLDQVNALRAKKSLRLLTLDQRFIETATEYAGYMGPNNVLDHSRIDGKTMHQWIDTKGLTFTVRYREGGWQTNYFTENISWNQIANNMTSAKAALDQTLTWMLAEASYNGAHFRTIYHADWNTVGSGFYFKDLGNDNYKMYSVFHYGSLQK